jgi:hypothetical protein
MLPIIMLPRLLASRMVSKRLNYVQQKALITITTTKPIMPLAGPMQQLPLRKTSNTMLQAQIARLGIKAHRKKRHLAKNQAARPIVTEEKRAALPMDVPVVSALWFPVLNANAS